MQGDRETFEGEEVLEGTLLAGRFKLLRELARGGMGRVFLAEQVALGRPCAVKLPHSDGGRSAWRRERLQREAMLTARLSHPRVVGVIDYGETPREGAFLAMEYLEGRTLGAHLSGGAGLDAEQVVGLAWQLADALEAVHHKGVVHRDLKPANVFLVDRVGGPYVKLLDFGLAVEACEPSVDAPSVEGGEENVPSRVERRPAGTPRYSSPEQILGDDPRPSMDVYAFGVILCEMLTGKVPFVRQTPMGELYAHLHEPVPALSDLNPEVKVPAALEALMRSCLAKDPAERVPSAGHVRAALSRV